MNTILEKETMTEILKEKIMEKKAKVGIIGLGYVGLPTMVHYGTEGFHVTGFDLDMNKINHILNGVSYIEDVESEELEKLHREKIIDATNDMERLKEVDVVYVCVPTPIDEFKQPDLSFVESAADTIANHISEGTVVIFESTTYPGTTEEIFLPKLEEQGFKVGENVFLAYSPERVDPGNETYNLTNTPKIVGGYTENCLELATLAIGKTAVKVSSIKVAEMSKAYENTFRWVNIAFVNEMAQIANKMGIEINEVIKACQTKPYGFMAFHPGPGVGGHCIPVDPYYITYKAKEFGEVTKMIELSGEINDKMPQIVVERAQDILNEKYKALKGSKIILLGVAYKPNVSDVRESPILPLVKLLKDKGANLMIVDDYIQEFRYKNQSYKTKKLTESMLKEADLVIVGTNHDSFDYGWVSRHTDTILDTRNVVVRDEHCEVVYL